MSHRFALSAVSLLFAMLCVMGIDWGLPSRGIDRYLFGDAEPWNGQKIHDLSQAQQKQSAVRGADVDADPLATAVYPVPLTDTDRKAAAVYLRYRLYTHQPDEMITLMALARMKPGSFDLDPGLYQYGGLFVYPVGAIIKLGGMLGLIEVRSDLVYYLDHPDAFGRFYVAARAYVAAWGLLGVWVVYAIGRRLGGSSAGLVSAMLYTVLPVVVCMTHEAKPHLPGAVLMLLGVWSAMRYVESARRRDWIFLCLACGSALGMVLSSLPVFVLIPLVELIRIQKAGQGLTRAVGRATGGLALALGTYAVTNPYVIINLFVNRQVLQSNFGNSLAMYQVTRIGEGFVRMIQLTAEGATWMVLVFGVAGLIILTRNRWVQSVPLLCVAGLLFVQFVLIGAGKPAEYGRFGILIDVTLVLATACLLTDPYLRRFGKLAPLPALAVAVGVGWFGYPYLANFMADASPNHSRMAMARALEESNSPLAVLAEPAPYCCPPLDFARRPLFLFRSADDWRQRAASATQHGNTGFPRLLLSVGDNDSGTSPISWANKPFTFQHAPGPGTRPQ
ncbi:MAG: ArnT family glycosyltransferase [Phycisphaerae bacterium]